MKSLILSGLIYFASATAFAANVTIAPGETLTLTPGRPTTVSCSGSGGGGENCMANEQGLKRQLDNCIASAGGNNTGWCIDKVLTADVKPKIADCSIAWAADCQESCVKGAGANNTGWCISKCQL